MIPSLVPGVRNPRYLLTLAGVAGLILLVGGLLRPRNEAAAPASDADLVRIARLSQRRSLENMTSYFSAVAASADLSVVPLRDLPTTAVAWSQGRIVAARVDDPFPATVRLATSGGDARAPVVLRRPDLPVVAIAAPATVAVVPARRSSSALLSGEWIVALWTGEHGRSFAHGNVVDVAPGSCGVQRVGQIVPTFALTSSMTGGGLFDLDGNLLGLILRCGDRLAVVDTDSLEMLLTEDDSVASRLLSRYGLRAGVPSADETAYFKRTDGLVVREVWLRYAAHAAGLRPGDVIRAIDGTPAIGPDDLQRLAGASADTPTRLTVQRGAARVEISLDPHDDIGAGVPAGAAGGRGLALQASEGFRIDAVTPGSPAAAADLRPGDRLIRVNLAAPSGVDQVRRLLDGASSRPAFLEVERQGRRFGVLLP